jgi:hypothetical protein
VQVKKNMSSKQQVGGEKGERIEATNGEINKQSLREQQKTGATSSFRTPNLAPHPNALKFLK